MKPFLLLATRADDTAAENEYEAFCRFTGLDEYGLHRIRLEGGPMPGVDLADYSGIIVGGSPFNSSVPLRDKSPVQRRVEAELARLLDRVVAEDFPFFGACYGIATLGTHQGGVIDSSYPEPVGAVSIHLSEAGRNDELLAGLPENFQAFVGHKESCSRLPESATLLASSPTCPIQMFRVKSNIYATQFHPELDADGLITRITIYDRHGYYPAGQAERVAEAARVADVSQVHRLLSNFAELYRR